MHAAQLARSAAGWRLRAAVSVPRTDAAPLDAEVRRLAGVLERRGFSGAAAVVGVPHEMLVSSVLELPPRSSGAPLAQLAAVELGRMHRRDPDAMEVALWEIPAANRAANGCEYMVTACAHDAANPFLDAFEDAGLDVLALDIPQLALLRAAAARMHPPPAMDALLHVGYDRCSLMIVTDGVIAYERALEGAEGKALVTLVTQRLGAPTSAVEEILCGQGAEVTADHGAQRAELESELRDFTTVHVAALVEQVHTSFSYVARRYTDRDLATVLLTGEFGGLPGLATRLAALSVQAQVLGAADTAPPQESLAGAISSGPSVVAAIGLAMHRERDAA
jgi:Tfp pilus assembly PilM family ATPase